MDISDLSIKVKETNEETLKEWNKLVTLSDDVTIFSSSFCHNIFPQYSICCFVYLQDELVGGTIGYIRGDHSILRFFAKSLWIDTGLLVNRNYSKYEIMIKVYLLDKLKEIAKTNSCIQVRIGQWNRERNSKVLKLANYVTENIKLYEVALNLAEDELFSGLNSKNRTKIRKAIKSRVRIKHCNRENSIKYFDEFYNLHCATHTRAIGRYKNVGVTIKSKDFLYKLIDNSLAFLSLAFHNDVLSSAVFLIPYNNKICGYVGASNIEINRSTASSNHKDHKFLNFR